jgi:hypothetical protein
MQPAIARPARAFIYRQSFSHAQGMIPKYKLPYVIKKERARSRWGCTRPRSADVANGRWTTVREAKKAPDVPGLPVTQEKAREGGT